MNQICIDSPDLRVDIMRLAQHWLCSLVCNQSYAMWICVDNRNYHMMHLKYDGN